MSIREEYVIERQGRRMALYPGVLDAAHKKGLNEIWTDLVQAPTEENGNVAIVKARVEVVQRDPDTGLPVTDPDGVAATQIFTAYGDASPGNVSRNIVPHVLRMAETRAKGRALRDAVNVAEALADDPTEEGEPPQGEPPRQELGAVDGGKNRPKKARKSQIDLLRQMVTNARGTNGVARMEDYLGKPLTELSQEEADEWIDKVTGWANDAPG